jgi:hypothetical protein
MGVDGKGTEQARGHCALRAAPRDPTYLNAQRNAFYFLLRGYQSHSVDPGVSTNEVLGGSSLPFCHGRNHGFMKRSETLGRKVRRY